VASDGPDPSRSIDIHVSDINGVSSTSTSFSAKREQSAIADTCVSAIAVIFESLSLNSDKKQLSVLTVGGNEPA